MLVLDEYEPYGTAVLWDLEAEIHRCDNDQLAIREATGEERPFCGRKTRVRPLIDVLVDLASARGTCLDLVLGEMAGLTRF